MPILSSPTGSAPVYSRAPMISSSLSRSHRSAISCLSIFLRHASRMNVASGSFCRTIAVGFRLLSRCRRSSCSIGQLRIGRFPLWTSASFSSLFPSSDGSTTRKYSTIDMVAGKSLPDLSSTLWLMNSTLPAFFTANHSAESSCPDSDRNQVVSSRSNGKYGSRTAQFGRIRFNLSNPGPDRSGHGACTPPAPSSACQRGLPSRRRKLRGLQMRRRRRPPRS